MLPVLEGVGWWIESVIWTPVLTVVWLAGLGLAWAHWRRSRSPRYLVAALMMAVAAVGGAAAQAMVIWEAWNGPAAAVPSLWLAVGGAAKLVALGVLAGLIVQREEVP